MRGVTDYFSESQMKIPDHVISKDEAHRIEILWQNAADQMSLESGIFIRIGMEYEYYPIFNRIFFKVEGHEFENLTDLKKALSLKAFL
jgi:hypothetical protein